jgi:hypothetical protein
MHTIAELKHMTFPPHEEIILQLQPDNGMEEKEVERALAGLLKIIERNHEFKVTVFRKTAVAAIAPRKAASLKRTERARSDRTRSPVQLAMFW